MDRRIPSLPRDLEDDCEHAQLGVALAPLPSAGALLTERLPAELGGRYWLVIDASWPEERIRRVVRQALADLGHPAHLDVQVEPFGFVDEELDR